MPTVYYKCKKCKKQDILRYYKTRAEQEQSILDEDTKCPNCGAVAEPQITAPNFTLKGKLQVVTETDRDGNPTKTV